MIDDRINSLITYHLNQLVTGQIIRFIFILEKETERKEKLDACTCQLW